jgi:trimeric autotransporter adhesin
VPKSLLLFTPASLVLVLVMPTSARSGPIAYFPMTEMTWSGSPPQVADATGNGHDGTVVNAAITVSGGPGNSLTRAGDFNGSNQYVTVGGSGSISGARTIVAWVLPNATHTLGLPILTGGVSFADDFFGIGGSAGENSRLPAGELYIDHWNHPAYHSSGSNGFVTLGVWNQVAVVYDGGTGVSFYINGLSAGSFTADAATSFYAYNDNTYVIGGNTIGGTTTQSSFDGLIDGLAIYNTALTASDIHSLYTVVTTPAAPPAPTTAPEPSTLALFAFCAVALAGCRHWRKPQ